MNYTIRPAQPEEATTIKQMVRSAHLNPFDLDYRRFLVAVDTSGIIGCVQTRLHGTTPELASLIVRADMRNNGIGSALVHSILDREQRPLYLYCAPGTAAYYTRFGFQRVWWQQTPPGGILRFFALLNWIGIGPTVMRHDQKVDQANTQIPSNNHLQ